MAAENYRNKLAVHKSRNRVECVEFSGECSVGGAYLILFNHLFIMSPSMCCFFSNSSSL